MINIGEVHCHWCGDSFEPDGLPSFEGPNFCSDSCEGEHEEERGDLETYAVARFGAAAVYGL